MSNVRAAVEESILTLSQKVITACEANSPEAARQYADGLSDACWGLEHIANAERDDD